ncbi:MAG: chemotaxis response regulator protein-glutamate methylesterase [Leptospiraceae bacterium]|nr:chemotaxis response regulator protein-glutamate methylesterase [Leptospiraceae bacterium]MCK6381044.1 chemotaxis response regulator protein-glutamate methylesterase [Leptospiraceae bacterium]NUM40209.1 chemotaxis response regulator protein-glutamate methylesterase [Leptospiraceae bacterium]
MIKVLIVDDSAIVRSLLHQNLKKFSDIEVVGTAVDPYDARDKIVELKPDVITLDLEMPRMNGLEFITVLMEFHPVPILVFSSLVDGECETSLKALELGALEVVPKPVHDLANAIPSISTILVNKIRGINGAKIQIIKANPETVKQITSLSNIRPAEKIIAIGSSTGGTEVIRYILEHLPEGTPPIIITQHMPEGFTTTYAKRLNDLCKYLEVREAESGDVLQHGLALIAPGNYHLILQKDGLKYKVTTKMSPKVNRFRPSVDVMFLSVAQTAGKDAIGVILTGMGSDGAEGLLKMKDSGSLTIAQSEKSCAVFGMPASAIKKNAVDYIEDIEEIPIRLLKILGKM